MPNQTRTKKIELLNVEDKAEAASQGWGLFHIYDMKTNRWLVEAQSLDMRIPVKQVMNFVTQNAQRGNGLHRRALRTISDNPAVPGRTK